MAITADGLFEETATTIVDTANGPVTLKFYPNAMTPAIEAEIAQETDEAFIAELFCEMVESWDLPGPLTSKTDADSDGKPKLLVEAGKLVPVEIEYVTQLPSRFLTKCFRQMRETMEQDGPKLNRHQRRSSMSSRRGSRRA